MHRHGYTGRKLQRERDQRRALMKGLATSLIRDEAIETTLPKAKEVVPYVEKLITKAKKGGLHQMRLVRTRVSTDDAVIKLFSQVAPSSNDRTSGHLRLEKTKLRRGDGSQLARVSFVDPITAKAKPTMPAKTPSKTSAKPAKAIIGKKDKPVAAKDKKETN